MPCCSSLYSEEKNRMSTQQVFRVAELLSAELETSPLTSGSHPTMSIPLTSRMHSVCQLAPSSSGGLYGVQSGCLLVGSSNSVYALSREWADRDVSSAFKEHRAGDATHAHRRSAYSLADASRLQNW